MASHESTIRQQIQQHGVTSFVEYYAWQTMRQRCANPKATGYKRYGGRGIRVCERWFSFETFILDMGPRPSPKHSIDRINNDGNYEPGNCRWATKIEQTRNRAQAIDRTAGLRMVTIDGRTQCVAAWCKERGVNQAMVRARIQRGYSPESALGKIPGRGRVLTYLGRSMRVSEWAVIIGIQPTTLWARLARGYSTEEVLSTSHLPTRPRDKKNVIN